MFAKILITSDGQKFYVKDIQKDVHTQFGFVKADDLKKAKNGTVVSTNTGKNLTVLEPSFLDSYLRIKRGPQVIPLKDIGLIIIETGISKKSTILDAGTGSGGLSCYLAHIAKKVVSYEIRDDFLEIAKSNKEMLELTNLTIKKGDICLGVKERDMDVMTLDLPEPWNAIDTAMASLAVGGYLVSYSPTIIQAADFVNAVLKKPAFLHLRTVEVGNREWEILDRKVRPSTPMLKHSGFISFVRKIA